MTRTPSAPSTTKSRIPSVVRSDHRAPSVTERGCETAEHWLRDSRTLTPSGSVRVKDGEKSSGVLRARERERTARAQARQQGCGRAARSPRSRPARATSTRVESTGW
eukprot:524062-Rhodomonas_salina.1